MGGLAFDDSDSAEKIWPPALERLALTPKFIKWCLRKEEFADIIPHITKEEIKDKSKANHLVKGLAVVQALWFCLQFITRLTQRLPVSLLELNTFAHSICALLIYVLWWEKPLDVEEPNLISTGASAKIRSLSAFATVHSKLDFYEYKLKASWGSIAGVFNKGQVLIWRVATDWKDRDLFYSKPPNTTRSVYTNEARLSGPLFIRPSLTRFEQPTSRSSLHSSLLRSSGLDRAENLYQYVSFDPPILYLQYGDQIPGTSFYLKKKSGEADRSLILRLRESGALSGPHQFDFLPLKFRISNFKGDTEVALEMLVALVITRLFYGGLHALAFGLDLRSGAETLCWKISCLNITCFGFTMILVTALFDWSQKLIGETITFIFFVAFLIFYVACRVFLVVEVFLSLPYVDPGVYETPNWSLYFPHIG